MKKWKYVAMKIGFKEIKSAAYIEEKDEGIIKYINKYGDKSN